MVRIALNLDEVQSFSDSNFPLGEHRAKLTDCDEQESSTGNPMLVWDWEGADAESQGETIRSYTSLLDNALSSFKYHAEAFGYSGNTEVDTDACVGKYAILVVALRKRRNRETGDETERPTIINVKPDTQARNGKTATATSGARRVGGGATATGARTVGKKAAGGDDLPF